MSGASANLVRHVNQLVETQRLAHLSDRQLLQRYAKERDQEAFALLLRRHGAMVFGVCRRLLGHEQDAEDAFQAVFLILTRRAGSIRQSDVGGFLYRVVYRLAIRARAANEKRRNQVGAASRAALVSSARLAEPTAEVTWREVQAVVAEEVQRLPEALRAAVVLCDLESQTLTEAARRLGCSKSTLYRRLTKARKLLRHRLTRRGLAPMAATTAMLFTEGSVPAALTAATVRGALQATSIAPEVASLVRSGSALLSLSRMQLATMIFLVVVTSGSLVGWYGWASGPLAATREPQLRSPSKPEAKTSIPLRGRVLGPDGKPIHGARLFVATGARVYLPHQGYTWTPHKESLALVQAGKSDGEGRFNIAIHRPDRGEHYYVLAYSDGLGVDWISRGEGELTADVTFRLPKDVPITGRILSTEGRPFSGVSVSAVAVFAPANDNMDDYLSGWLGKLTQTLPPDKRLLAPLEGILGAVKTDKDGRFTLHGVGRERLVHVDLSGGDAARSTLCVITRPGFDAASYNAVLRTKQYEFLRVLNRHLGLHPPSFTFVVEPGKTVEGKIKDADTGKPLSGFRVEASTGYHGRVAVVSDAEGKYRIDGLPNYTKTVYVKPPEGSDYLQRHASWGQSGVRFGKIQRDVEMVKGAVVTGWVRDKQTGKGVRSGVRVATLKGNKSFASKSGFDNYGFDRAWARTDEDGRFRLVIIPGKSLVMAQVHKGEMVQGKTLCRYRLAVPDPQHKDIFQYDADNDTWLVATANGLEFINGENAVKVIDAQIKGQNRVELFVDRGGTRQIEVRDAEGKPLSGVWAAGLTETWPITFQLPDATATVYALTPDKPRTMAFFHSEKKLGGTAIVRGEEKEPVIVRLAPLSQAIGRLLDAEGKPLEGVEVSIQPRTIIGRELYRFAVASGKMSRTDKHGRFRLANIVPNLQFEFRLRRERTYFRGEPRLGIKQVKPGETLDLGDVRVKPR